MGWIEEEKQDAIRRQQERGFLSGNSAKRPIMVEVMTWEKVIKAVDNLASQLPPDSCVWGVPRGGVIVATLLAYRGFTMRLTRLPYPGDIVVDDIADTGKTLGAYGVTATLVIRQGCEPRPTYVGWKLAGESYVLFPWETDKEVPENGS